MWLNWSLGCGLAFFVATHAGAQNHAERFVSALGASADGSLLVISIKDDAAEAQIVAIAPSTVRMLWTLRQPGTATSFSFSEDSKKLAVGYRVFSDSEDGIKVLDAKTGKLLAGQADGPDGLSLGMGFASWGGGVKAVAFVPGGKALIGLSNDTLFA